MRENGVLAAMTGQRQTGLFVRLIALTLFFALTFPGSSAFSQGVDPNLVKQYMQQKGGGVPDVTGSPLDQARERAQGINNNNYGSGNQPFNQMQAQAVPRNVGPSRLERDYQKRTNSEITQFGYDIFAGRPDSTGIVTGRISENYVLGVGDELVVTFQGQSANTITTYVDREGRVMLAGLRPINAAGRSFGDFRADLERSTKASLIGTDVYVSLGSVRMASVYILGEVARPGLYRLTSLTTALEALNVAGGVQKSGSLRRIRIEHGGKSVPLDFYAMLAGEHSADIGLHDGDRLVVPPVGPTVAVTGDVVRPAIYELSGTAGLTLDNLLKLAGGTLRPRGYAYVLNRMDLTGRQQYTTLEARNARIAAGDVIDVSLRENGQVGGVTLTGAVRAPGLRSLDEAPTLRKLLGDAHNLGETPYLLFGAIQRVDTDSRAKILEPFSPERVLAGADDVALKDGDTVVILDQRDVAFLASRKVRGVVSGLEMASQCHSLNELARIVNDSQSNRFAAAIRIITSHGVNIPAEDQRQTKWQKMQSQSVPEDNSGQMGMQRQAGAGGDMTQMGMQRQAGAEGDMTQVGMQRQAGNGNNFDQIGMRSGPKAWSGSERDSDRYNPNCPESYEKINHLLPFTLEYVVSTDGALRVPGVYPVAEKTSLASLVAAAGGSVYNADLTKIEIMDFEAAVSGDKGKLGRQYVDASGTGLSSIFIGPGSGVHINALFSDQEPGGVVVSGEVRSPGVYSIRRGETLSELLERAGGLTSQAFPYGAVFTRTRVKEAEQEELKRAARQLDSAMASALLSKRDIKPESAAAVQALSDKISTAEVAGRIVVEADPTVLRSKPQLDTVLEPGDQIFLPKRPNYVLLIGDVLNPTALQFTPDKKVGEYLREAGGVQATADKGRIFVVYPNGKAMPVRTSSWGFGSGARIPAGSAIVIPKDPMPFDSMSFFKDITQILSQLAISAASIAVISK